MGEPAVDKNTSVSEALEEINQQMEDLNTNSKQEENQASEPSSESDTNEQELNLSAEEPPDFEDIEKLIDSKDETDGGDQKEEVSEPETVPKDEGQDDTLSSDDEAHIDITDDELWEDDDVEEIPLFEEEFLEQELEGDNKKEGTPDADISEPSSQQEGGEDPSASTDPEIEKSTGKKQATTQDDIQDETIAPSVKTDLEEQASNDPTGKSIVSEKVPGKFIGVLPWIISAVSGILCVLAIVTLLLISSGPAVQGENPERPVTKQAIKKAVQKNIPSLAHGPVRGTVQAIDLAPFLIPAQNAGELVFFKLKVELIVPNATTKQELLKREAWVRDIIYQELKGINISGGIRGDILNHYRRPILNRLNKEMAPLRIEDVRLMGFLLR